MTGDELEPDDDEAAGPEGSRKPSRRSSNAREAAPSGRSRLRLALFGILGLLVLASPLWAPLIMRRMAFFHVHRVEVLGARYTAPGEIIARLHVDTSTSIWNATRPLERRILAHPGIARATVERRLPGTLVVRITERTPVALVPANGGFRVYDERGAALPIDPTRVTVDAPIMMQPDRAGFRLLGAMRMNMPDLYAQVSTVRRTGTAELLLELKTIPVRVMQDVTLDRLAEIGPVEADLGRKQLHALELDLRYRDQVIARLQ